MSEDYTTQPRDAEGKFGERPHGEPMVALFDRNDGSFLHPSPSSTAEHCINFWSKAAIPDEVISQFEKAYLARYEEIFNRSFASRMAEFERKWRGEHPAPRKEKDLPAYEAELQSAKDAVSDQITDAAVQETTPQLVSYDIRQLIRATQMVWHRPRPKFENEGDKVLDYQVELYDGPMTLRDIAIKYRLEELHWTMEEIHADKGVKDIIAAIDRASDQVGQDVRNVGGDIRDTRRDRGYID